MTMDFRFYWLLFMRRLPYFLLVAVTGSALGLTLAQVLPPVFVAEASLVVEGEQIPNDLAASTVRTVASEQLQIIQERVLARDSLLEMANKLNIYADETDAAGSASPRRNADEIVADLRKRIQIAISGDAGKRGATQATLVTVSFEAPTATLSAAVTNEVVTMILAQDVEMRTGSARQTLNFFEQEVTRLDQELISRGAIILEFKQKNQDALPDSLEFRRTQRVDLQNQFGDMGRQKVDLIAQRDRLIRIHGTTGNTEGGFPAAQITPERAQLQALQAELAAALGVMSAENPKVVLLQAQVVAQEKVVAAQVAGGLTGADGQELSAFDIQLAEFDRQIAVLATQKDELTTAMDTLQQSIDATAGNASALDTLERDYSNLREQYNQAVAAKARAETGDMIETLSKGQKIVVIDQAVVPAAPSRPNRLLIALGGVGGGILAGLGLVFLLEALNSAIRRPVELTNKLGITPLATLPFLRTPGQIRWRRAKIALALIFVLAAIPAGLWLVDRQVMPLDLLLDRVLSKFNLAALARSALPVLV